MKNFLGKHWVCVPQELEGNKEHALAFLWKNSQVESLLGESEIKGEEKGQKGRDGSRPTLLLSMGQIFVTFAIGQKETLKIQKGPPLGIKGTLSYKTRAVFHEVRVSRLLEYK